MEDLDTWQQLTGEMAALPLLFNAPLSEQHATRLVDDLHLQSKPRILDLGCGWGELLLRALATMPGAIGVGVDHDLPAVRRARIALTMLGAPEAAYREQGKARELWHPTRTDPAGDLDRPAALLELDRGRLDTAEQFAAASVRRWEGVSEPARTRSGVVLATIHVRAGEPGGPGLAHDAITRVGKLRSVRARKLLLPLADALEARPGGDTCRGLARSAREVATTRA